MRSTVAIVKTPPAPCQAEIEAAVRRVIDLAGGLGDIVRPGSMILLKPNLVMRGADLRCGVCTSAEVSRAMADLVRELGGRPVIAESSAVGCDTEDAISFMGYDRLRAEGYEVVDLKRTPTVRVPVPAGEVVQEVTTWELVTQADAIISLPVMKTHDQCELTLSLKNLKGLIHDRDKRLLHRLGVNAGVADLNTLFRPAFTVVDAIWCQEGLGPTWGIPVEMDLLLAGRDLVAVDAVGGAIMGFAPGEVWTITTAAGRGLGTADLEQIEVVGEPIAAVGRRFMRVLEDQRMQLEGGPTIIHSPGTCTGCRAGLGSTLYDMKNEGLFEYAAGRVIVTGDAEPPADVPVEDVIAIGICCPQELRERATWVPGCPPNNIHIKQAIVGDQAEVKPAYGRELPGWEEPLPES